LDEQMISDYVERPISTVRSSLRHAREKLARALGIRGCLLGALPIIEGLILVLLIVQIRYVSRSRPNDSRGRLRCRLKCDNSTASGERRAASGERRAASGERRAARAWRPFCT
jgi:hypothetical protein